MEHYWDAHARIRTGMFSHPAERILFFSFPPAFPISLSLPPSLAHSAAEPLITATKLFSFSPGNEASCLLQSQLRINWLCFTIKIMSVFVIVAAVKYHQHSAAGFSCIKAMFFFKKTNKQKFNFCTVKMCWKSWLFQSHVGRNDNILLPDNRAVTCGLRLDSWSQRLEVPKLWAHTTPSFVSAKSSCL